MSGDCLIGLDAGTTAVKGILLSPDRGLLATAGREYSLESQGDRCEVEPEVYWRATVEVIRDLLAQAGVNGEDVRAVAFASQGETIIPVDEDGRPLCKAIVWLDNRSVKEAEQIDRFFDHGEVLKRTGQPEIVPIWPATRILWLRTHEPEIFDRVHKYLLVEDYLMYRLSGRFVTEASIVSSTLYYDIVRKEWWSEMLSYLGIRANQLPEVLDSGTAVGTLTPEALAETGLSPDTLLVTGAYDHPAGAIGAGNISPGVVSVTTGASMAMVVTLDEPVLRPELSLPCQCHAIQGEYFLLPYGQTAGMVLRWFRDKFFERDMEATGDRDFYDQMTALAAEVPPGAEGLVMLPHLMGSGSPEFDTNAAGVFAGVRLGMGRAHFIRANLESVACMIRRNLDTMRASGIEVRELRALGGAAKSTLWNQLIADVTGIPLATVEIPETPSLGAAILAGVGSGLFASISEGCELLVRKKRVFVPDSDLRQVYDQVFRRYEALTDQLEPYWRQDFLS